MAKPRMKNETYKAITVMDTSDKTMQEAKEDIWNLYFNRLWNIDQIAHKYKKAMTYAEVRSIIFERLK